MTTIAFDGKTIAADSLAVDAWGLKSEVGKIEKAGDFLIAGAGTHGLISGWVRYLLRGESEKDPLKLYYPYIKDQNDPSILLVDTKTKQAYFHETGHFFPIPRSIHALGSGRDYALAAMSMGASAQEAVEVAMRFDNNTGGTIVVVEV